MIGRKEGQAAGSWTSENSSPPFHVAAPKRPLPQLPPLLMGCRVYKPRGHSVLQVEPGASVCVRASDIKTQAALSVQSAGLSIRACHPTAARHCRRHGPHVRLVCNADQSKNPG